MMNNEQIKKLAIDLYAAEKEDDIEKILKNNNLWDESNWAYFKRGDKDISANSIAGAQQDNPINALVEKITNSIDAVLTKECLKRGIDPTSKNAPDSMRAAQIEYFNIHDGNLSNIGQSERTKLSQNIHLVASGYKSKNPNLAIIDKGEGQEPNAFKNTLLSLNASLKNKVQFVQGKHGMGGTGVVVYCSKKHRFQLIISKRNNEIPNRSSDEWGVTIVRKVAAKDGEKSNSLRYLAPNQNILSFKANELNVIPKFNKADKSWDFSPLESGTIIKLYEYNLDSEKKAGRARDSITRWLQDRLSTMLPAPALPFYVSDMRHKERDTNRLFNPLNVRLVEDSRDNIDFEFSSTLMVEGEKFPCRVLLFKYDHSKGDDQGKRTYARHNEGILFALNGQTHGCIDETFFTKIGFGEIKVSLYVLIDCTNMSINMQEVMFMNSRDRIRESGTKKEFLKKITTVIKENPELKDAVNKRVKEKNDHSINSSHTLEKAVQKIVNMNPTLTRLFINGKNISSPIKQITGNAIDEPFEGKRFPTFFSLKKQHGIDKPRDAELKRKIRILFDTDVQNDYFYRDRDKGTFDFFVNDEVASIDSFAISNGIAVLNLLIDDRFQLDETYKLTTRVSDVSRALPFEEDFWIKITPYKKTDGSNSVPRPPKPKPDGEGDRKLPKGLAFPKVNTVNSSSWSTFQMNGKSAVNVDYNGPEEGWTFYVNNDNDYLMHYANDNKRKNLQILRKKYAIAILLFGIAIINDELDENAENNGEISKKIEEFSKNISIVLLPIIDDIGREDSSMLDGIEIEEIEENEEKEEYEYA